MKSMLCLLLLAVTFSVTAQNFNGTWSGTLTRDYGDETVTDTIALQLVQTGSQIKGYSILFLASGDIIRSRLEGTLDAKKKMLRLTETGLANGDNAYDASIYFDRYLLSYDDGHQNFLAGKSVCCDKTARYSKSKMLLKKEI